MLFLHNTSRVEGEPYPRLLQEKGFSGFPSLCFMDAEGNVLAKPAQRTVAAYAETLASAKDLLALRQKGDARTEAETKQLFLTELKLDLIPVGEIEARAAAVKGLTAEEQAAAQQKIVDGQYQALMGKMRQLKPEELAAQVAAMAKAGRIPSGRSQLSFWNQVLTHAANSKDVPLAEQAFGKLQEQPSQLPAESRKRMQDNWQKLLDQAKAK